MHKGIATRCNGSFNTPKLGLNGGLLILDEVQFHLGLLVDSTSRLRDSKELFNQSNLASHAWIFSLIMFVNLSSKSVDKVEMRVATVVVSESSGHMEKSACFTRAKYPVDLGVS